jgi:hypothetical protein
MLLAATTRAGRYHNCPNAEGVTPLQVAKDAGHDAIAAMLEMARNRCPHRKTHVCANCGKQDKMWRCSGCKQVHYCNVASQAAHWDAHKQVCRR